MGRERRAKGGAAAGEIAVVDATPAALVPVSQQTSVENGSGAPVYVRLVDLKARAQQLDRNTLIDVLVELVRGRMY